MNRKITLIQGALVALFLVMCIVTVFADEPKLPLGITCEMVRERVSEHGKYVAYAWATLQGYSKRDIAEARKCLR